MTSENNEGEKRFNELTAALSLAPLLAVNIAAPTPQPNIQNRPNYTDYSAVQKQQPKSCPLDQESENDLEAQNYESLPGIARLSNFTEQLDQVAELQAGEDKEKREEEREISVKERNMAKSSGSPDPEQESEEGEYVSEYMKDIESRLEAGTLTLKSPEEKSESELRESETESESEYSESETESESESHSEMKWG
ncbi:hypothetical protein [Microcoleus sp. herbarium14]|uniref:hypothetical protein n=1 Tax=Microcoleus sp. herbarium14 TaxID=3055439 RepID=UPI002FD67F86